MRTRIIPFILFISAAVCTMATAKIHWLSLQHDFGAFDEDLGTVECQFKGVNIGDEPLAIIGARATCGCTVPSYNVEPVAPGDTAIIAVKYNATGRPGRFSKKVYVDTNDPDEQRTTLEITGVVIGNSNSVRGRFPIQAGQMKLRQNTVAFGPLYKGQAKNLFLDGYNASSDTLYPKVIYSPKYIDIKFTPEAVPPGEQVSINFYNQTGLCERWGTVTDSVVIITDASEKPFTISTVFIQEEDFSKMTPEQLKKAPIATLQTMSVDLGRIDLKDWKEPIVRTIEIKNTGGGAPLEIRRLSTTGSGIKVEADNQKIKNGKSGNITIKVTPEAAENGMVNARITLVTNDPSRSTQIIRVVGEAQ